MRRPSPCVWRFSRLARELDLWLVFGMDENRDGSLFDSAVLMNPSGGIEGIYSKVHLQNWMTASGVTHGNAFPVWKIHVDNVEATVGAQICYHIQHPVSSRELALGDAEILFVPYCASDFSRPLLIHLFETRALENRAYVLRVNYGAPRNSGTSSIIDFEGVTQAQLDRAPGVLVGDLNLTALSEVRAAWNPVYGAPYRRPAAYKRIAQPSPTGR
ncbi:MAG: carbon-nitrogen hydrolase family protein [Bryobacteraceae bacterium]|nr:carbon-nitrogen hydrolase family protein [Bryobacteraceae bacterium]